MTPREIEAALERYARDGTTGTLTIHIQYGAVKKVVASETIEVLDTRVRVTVESP